MQSFAPPENQQIYTISSEQNINPNMNQFTFEDQNPQLPEQEIFSINFN